MAIRNGFSTCEVGPGKRSVKTADLHKRQRLRSPREGTGKRRLRVVDLKALRPGLRRSGG